MFESDIVQHEGSGAAGHHVGRDSQPVLEQSARLHGVHYRFHVARSKFEGSLHWTTHLLEVLQDTLGELYG